MHANWLVVVVFVVAYVLTLAVDTYDLCVFLSRCMGCLTINVELQKRVSVDLIYLLKLDCVKYLVRNI